MPPQKRPLLIDVDGSSPPRTAHGWQNAPIEGVPFAQRCNSVTFSDRDYPVPERIRAGRNNNTGLSIYISSVKQRVQLVVKLFRIVHACPAVARQRRVRSYARASPCNGNVEMICNHCARTLCREAASVHRHQRCGNESEAEGKPRQELVNRPRTPGV